MKDCTSIDDLLLQMLPQKRGRTLVGDTDEVSGGGEGHQSQRSQRLLVTPQIKSTRKGQTRAATVLRKTVLNRFSFTHLTTNRFESREPVWTWVQSSIFGTVRKLPKMEEGAQLSPKHSFLLNQSWLILCLNYSVHILTFNLNRILRNFWFPPSISLYLRKEVGLVLSCVLL